MGVQIGLKDLYSRLLLQIELQLLAFQIQVLGENLNLQQ